jgi:hypothetical protein
MLITLVAHRIIIQTIIGLIILSVLLWVGILGGWYTLNSVLSLIPYFIITAMAAWVFFNIGEEVKNYLGRETSQTIENLPYKPDPTFDHLEFHFLKEKDNEALMTSRLRYLIDTSRGNAYLIHQIPEWLDTVVKGHSFLWVPHDDIRDLKKYIQQSKLTVIDISPSPQAVGLKYVTDSWQKENLYADLLIKIGKNKIEDLQLARLERRYFFSIRRRMLIVDFSAQEIWLAPLCWRVLIQNSIVTDETYAMKWREKCKPWAKRWSKEECGKEFHFNPNHYPESLLITKSLAKKLET